MDKLDRILEIELELQAIWKLDKEERDYKKIEQLMSEKHKLEGELK